MLTCLKGIPLVKDATAAWSEELYQAATTLVYPLFFNRFAEYE